MTVAGKRIKNFAFSTMVLIIPIHSFRLTVFVPQFYRYFYETRLTAFCTLSFALLEIWIFILQCINFSGVTLIFLSAIVLQTDSATECINNFTFRVDSPAKPILPVLSPTDYWSYPTVGLTILVKTSISNVPLYTELSIRWSIPVCHKSYFL